MVYAEAPWVFKGRALYQLQLVKADEARRHIPKGLELVEFFGYTLGGFYLARYDDSPVGAFDECVAMAGLVWNRPTSCAWAARVYVSNKDARDHGLNHVGLPSRLAAFTPPPPAAAAAPEEAAAAAGASWSCRSSWWAPQAGEKLLARRGKKTIPGFDSSSSSSSGSTAAGSLQVDLFNSERGARGLADGLPVCSFVLPASIRTAGFLGPRMRLALPSFSGGTVDHPGLLEYSCDLQTNIMPVASLKVELPPRTPSSSSSSQRQRQQQQAAASCEVLDTLLAGKPVMTLAFSDMVMTVQEPKKLLLPAAAVEPAVKVAKKPAAGGALAAPLAALLAWR